jgi:hypothetical protein
MKVTMALGLVNELPYPQMLQRSGATVGEFPELDGAGVWPATRVFVVEATATSRKAADGWIIAVKKLFSYNTEMKRAAESRARRVYHKTASRWLVPLELS